MAVGLGINKGRQLTLGHGEGKLLTELPPPSLELRSLRALVRGGLAPSPLSSLSTPPQGAVFSSCGASSNIISSSISFASS